MYYNPDYDGVQHNNEGWICPRCGCVNAPWVSRCRCNGSVTVTYTKDTGSTAPSGKSYTINPSSYCNCSGGTTPTTYTGINDSLVTTQTIHDGNTQFNKTILQEDIK